MHHNTDEQKTGAIFQRERENKKKHSAIYQELGVLNLFQNNTCTMHHNTDKKIRFKGDTKQRNILGPIDKNEILKNKTKTTQFCYSVVLCVVYFLLFKKKGKKMFESRETRMWGPLPYIEL